MTLMQIKGFMKKAGVHLFNRINFINTICTLIGLGVVLNFIIFGCNLAFDYPLGDQWRWLRGLLIPYINNDINFWQYISGEFGLLSHSHILTLLFMLLNFELFQLRFDLDVYLGIGCYVLSAFIIFFYFKRICSKHYSNSYWGILLVILTLVYFSLSSVTIFTWTLLSFELLYWLIAVVLLILYDQFILINCRPIPFLVWFIVVFFLGDAMGITALLTTILISAFLLLISPQKQKLKIFILQIGILVFCIIITIYLFPEKKHSASKLSSLVYIVDNPVEAVHFIVNCFSQSIIDQSGIKHFFGNHFKCVQLTIGTLVIILNVFCFYLYLIKKIYIRTTLPLAFLIFTIISISGIMLTRLSTFGPEYAFGNRYNRLFQPSFMFCLFVLGESLLLNSSSWDAICKKMFIFLFICVCMIQIGTTMFRWKYIGSQWKYQGCLIEETYDYYKTNSNERFDKLNPRCRNHFCDSSLTFLAEKKLSFFREDILKKYQISK